MATDIIFVDLLLLISLSLLLNNVLVVASVDIVVAGNHSFPLIFCCCCCCQCFVTRNFSVFIVVPSLLLPLLLAFTAAATVVNVFFAVRVADVASI